MELLPTNKPFQAEYLGLKSLKVREEEGLEGKQVSIKEIEICKIDSNKGKVYPKQQQQKKLQRNWKKKSVNQFKKNNKLERKKPKEVGKNYN